MSLICQEVLNCLELCTEADDPESTGIEVPGVKTADIFEVVNRYYEGGVSSVYFWDLDDGFAGVVLIKKSMYLWTWC